MKQELVAPCGMNCNICKYYLREKNPCPGCRIDDPDKSMYCRECIIANCDVIKNSHEKPSIAFSPEISDALKALKDFNLERIYTNPKSKVHSATIEQLFSQLFEMRLEELETNQRSSDIFSGFLADMSESYIAGHSAAEIVRDYIAGMTDRYFLHQFPESMRPENSA